MDFTLNCFRRLSNITCAFVDKTFVMLLCVAMEVRVYRPQLCNAGIMDWVQDPAKCRTIDSSNAAPLTAEQVRMHAPLQYQPLITSKNI